MKLILSPFYLLIQTLCLALTTWAATSSVNIQNNVLIISTDSTTAETATQGLISYGIPYTVLVVPSAGAALPALNNSDGSGNFNLFVVQGMVSYNYGTDTSQSWSSALTAAQWKALYDYQTMYAVRMIHQNVYPGTAFGTSALGGCCNTGEDQTVTLDSTVAAAKFPTAGLKYVQIFRSLFIYS